MVYEEGGTEEITIGNACPVIDNATGTIWLTLCRDNDYVLVTSSKDDGGKSWRLGGSLDRHTDECQVVELTDGSLMLNMRNYWGRAGGGPERGGMRAIAISKDGGETWSELSFDDTLVEPVCQASFLRYSDTDSGERNLLLFSNPASKTSRHRLTVRLSDSEGKSWAVARVLREGPSAYSCLTVLADQSIGCLYEGGEKHPYEKMIFARFGLDWLEGKKD